MHVRAVSAVDGSVIVSYPKRHISRYNAWKHLEGNYPSQVPTGQQLGLRRPYNPWKRAHNSTHWRWVAVLWRPIRTKENKMECKTTVTLYEREILELIQSHVAEKLGIGAELVSVVLKPGTGIDSKARAECFINAEPAALYSYEEKEEDEGPIADGNRG